MNEFAGYARPVPSGFWAMLRLARDAQPKPIMGKGDKPIIFASELDATKAVLTSAFAYFNGDYRRCGDTLTTSTADAHFIGLKPFTRSKGRRIEVQQVGGERV